MRVLVIGSGALVAEALGALINELAGVRVVGVETATDANQLADCDAECVVIDELVDPRVLPLERWLARHPQLTLARVAAADRRPIEPTRPGHAPRTRAELAGVLRGLRVAPLPTGGADAAGPRPRVGRGPPSHAGSAPGREPVRQPGAPDRLAATTTTPTGGAECSLA